MRAERLPVIFLGMVGPMTKSYKITSIQNIFLNFVEWKNLWKTGNELQNFISGFYFHAYLENGKHNRQKT